MALTRIKRGDTFSFSVNFTDLNNEPIVGVVDRLKSQVRDSEENLLSDLEITEEFTVVDEQLVGGTYIFKATNTNSWPIETVYFDFQYTDEDGNVDSTPTYSIKVERDVTYD